jgi:hypothetical protein
MTYVGGTAAPPTFVTATVWGFPWQTGNVGGVAAVDSTDSSTTTSASAADHRTPSGIGTLQLVTPFLVRVNSTPAGCEACTRQWFYAGTARAELRFTPEAGASLLLTSGLAGLAVLFRFRRMRRRGPDRPTGAHGLEETL